MAIELVRVGDKFRATVTPPDGDWVSDEPLTATEILEQLSKVGVHSTEITDALDATGADWRPVHDEVVLRRRAEEAEGRP